MLTDRDICMAALFQGRPLHELKVADSMSRDIRVAKVDDRPEDGSLDLLATAPLPMEGAVLVKAAAHWITTGLPLVVAAPVFGILLHLPSGAQGWLVAALLLGTPALSILGAFGAALTVGLRRGGLLMSLLVLPLYVPTLIFGAEAVRRGAAGGDGTTPLVLLAGITLATLAAIPFAAAGALRVNLR